LIRGYICRSNNFVKVEQIQSPVEEQDSRRHTCRTCKQQFGSYLLLRRHRYHFHIPKTKTHLCPVCGKLFQSKHQLQLHLEVHDDRLKHYCEVCDKHLKSTHMVRSHRLFHSVAGQKCPDCGIVYNFASARAFYAHRRLHRSSEEFVCDECGKSFRNRDGLRQHKKTHDDSEFPCESCDKKFRCKSGLTKHMGIVHDGKRYICDVCGKGLTTAQNLREHMMVHSGNKPYSCTECDKTFVTKQHLRIHKRNHTNEKPYQCSFCDKAFTNLSGYHLHVRRVHENKRPFVCDVCLKGFATRGALRVHSVVHVRPIIKQKKK
jgi:uncharacterized Zn-finger protein